MDMEVNLTSIISVETCKKKSSFWEKVLLHFPERHKKPSAGLQNSFRMTEHILAVILWSHTGTNMTFKKDSENL